MKKIGEHILRSNTLSKNHSCSPENKNYCFFFVCQVDRSSRKMSEEMEMRFSTPLWGQCTQYAETALAAVSAEIVKKRRQLWSKLVLS